MFKINNHKLQNKRTGEKIGPEKITVQYLIRILQMGNLLEKNNRACAIIQYSRVLLPLFLLLSSFSRHCQLNQTFWNGFVKISNELNLHASNSHAPQNVLTL